MIWPGSTPADSGGETLRLSECRGRPSGRDRHGQDHPEARRVVRRTKSRANCSRFHCAVLGLLPSSRQPWVARAELLAHILAPRGDLTTRRVLADRQVLGRKSILSCSV